MLLAVIGSARMVKNCDLGLESAAYLSWVESCSYLLERQFSLMCLFYWSGGTWMLVNRPSDRM